jgi:hypothetical protein
MDTNMRRTKLSYVPSGNSLEPIDEIPRIKTNHMSRRSKQVSHERETTPNNFEGGNKKSSNNIEISSKVAYNGLQECDDGNCTFDNLSDKVVPIPH